MKKSKVAPGSGVAKEKLPPEQKKPENKEDGKPYDVKVNPDGSPVWSETPTIADQFVSLNSTCREEPPMCSIFKLPEDLDRYNKLIARTVPLEAPRTLIYLEEREFYEGEWLILVKHSKVVYKKLIPPTKSNIEQEE